VALLRRHGPATYDPSDETASTLDDGDALRQMRKVLASPRADFSRAFTPHSMRHTFASQLLPDVKELHYVRDQLDHESIKLTADTIQLRAATRPESIRTTAWTTRS
jgi:integrase